MKKVKRFFSIVACMCLIAVLVMAILVIRGNLEIHVPDEPEEVVEIEDQEEKMVISRHDINRKMESIQEVATYEFTYQGHDISSEKRDVFGIKDVWGTEKSLDVTYCGVIKMGYDMDDINYRIDNNNMKIVVILPSPQVMDNYVILDSLVVVEHNNILNPIETSDIQEMLVKIEQLELSEAKNQGIEVKAEEHMKSIIENYLSEFFDYSVEFA